MICKDRWRLFAVMARERGKGGGNDMLRNIVGFTNRYLPTSNVRNGRVKMSSKDQYRSKRYISPEMQDEATRFLPIRTEGCRFWSSIGKKQIHLHEYNRSLQHTPLEKLLSHRNQPSSLLSPPHCHKPVYNFFSFASDTKINMHDQFSMKKQP